MIGVFCLLFYILFCFYLIQMQFIHSNGRGIICFDRTVALKFLNLFFVILTCRKRLKLSNINLSICRNQNNLLTKNSHQYTSH